jgi:hypothetical protein
VIEVAPQVMCDGMCFSIYSNSKSLIAILSNGLSCVFGVFIDCEGGRRR